MEVLEKVSIIVPVYNVGKYVRKCIESICMQTYKNLEIILIDDGSSDDSGKICDYMAQEDSRIIVIHKVNGGVSAARNDGIREATGTYVGFVDGDDYVCKDYVDYLYKMIKRFDVPISLTTGFFTTYENKQISNERCHLKSGEDAVEGILCYNIPIGVYCKLFSRKFLIKNHINFRTDLFIGEGFNFNVTAFQQANKVAMGNRKIYHYRLDNPTSATTAFSEEKWINGLYATKQIKENLIIKSEKVNDAWEYAWWHTCADVYNLLIISGQEKQYKQMYDECRFTLSNNIRYAFRVPCSRREKFKAIVYAVFPRLIPKLKVMRKQLRKIVKH